MSGIAGEPEEIGGTRDRFRELSLVSRARDLHRPEAGEMVRDELGVQEPVATGAQARDQGD